MKKRKPVELSIGGKSWEGFYFGQYGRASEWRLHTPDGSNYVAGEIAQLGRLSIEHNYLQSRTRELEAQIDGRAFHLSVEQLTLLRTALTILDTVLPSQRWLGVHHGVRIKRVA